MDSSCALKRTNAHKQAENLIRWVGAIRSGPLPQPLRWRWERRRGGGAPAVLTSSRLPQAMACIINFKHLIPMPACVEPQIQLGLHCSIAPQTNAACVAWCPWTTFERNRANLWFWLETMQGPHRSGGSSPKAMEMYASCQLKPQLPPRTELKGG